MKLASAAGADLLFFEGIRNKEDLELAVQSLAPKPVCYSVYGALCCLQSSVLGRYYSTLWLGESPQILPQRRQKLWVPNLSVRPPSYFVVKFLTCLPVYPLITIVPAIHAMRESLQSLKRTGSDVDSAQGMGPRQFFQIMGECAFPSILPRKN